MTDIIECENELNKYQRLLDLYYPYITDMLREFDTKETFLQHVHDVHNTRTRKEWYNLFGYPKKLDDDEQSYDIVNNYCRINGYPQDVVFTKGDSSLFNEWCIYNQVASLPVESIHSNTGFELKYINKDTSYEDRVSVGGHLSFNDKSNLDFVRIHQYKNGTATALAEAEKKIKFNDATIGDNLKAWKRMRQLIGMYMNSNVIGVKDMLLQHVPEMKLVKDNVFSNVEGDLKALTEIKKLIALLPYEKSEDKLFLLNYIDHFMEMKDIVNMLPQYKDCWNNGRLIFEIGDDEKDLFRCYKGVMNTKYFIITVNPVDMLFCSSDQEYRSCFGLDSPHGSNKGLINFLARPDTCMCFLSSGSLSKPWKDEIHYKGLAFNHIKIKARAFIYNSLDKHMADVGRCYAPYEICNAGRHEESLHSFRMDARVWLWYILQQANQGFDLSPYVSSRQFRKYLSDPDRLMRIGLDFNFETAGLTKRTFKGHTQNEVYFDNLSFDREDPAYHGYYYATVGQGCCSRFNAREGNLGDLYTQELNKIVKAED